MLHYQSYIISKDAEWVTFLHGAGGSSSIWYKQLRAYKSHFNVLMLDLRGHGKSKLPAYDQFKKYSFEVIGNDVIEVLDQLKIKKSHFVGISLGTIIARELAERFPDRTRKLVLGGAIMKLNLRSRFLMRMGVLLKYIVPYLLLYKLLAFVIMPRKNHKSSRNLFIREAKKLYQKEFIRWFTLAAEVNQLLYLFRIKDSGIPTLYIMGSEDYMFLPSIRKLVKDHLFSQLSVILKCGHVVNIDAPNDFNQLSLQFLRS